MRVVTLCTGGILNFFMNRNPDQFLLTVTVVTKILSGSFQQPGIFGRMGVVTRSAVPARYRPVQYGKFFAEILMALKA